MSTIYDVARRAGVSTKTVSRVLNGEGPVNADTREQVEAAMRDLGYVPSNAARMMRSNRSGLVGVITGAITTADQGPQTQGLPDLLILQGIQRAMSAGSRTLMIADTAGRSDRVQPLIETFLRHRVEGLIYVADHHQKVTLPPVPAETPLVLVNCFDDKGTPAVLPDDRRGQYELVARIIEAGHARIAYISLKPHIVATGLRIEGYRMALAEAGLPFDPDLVVAGEREDMEGEADLLVEAIDRLFALPAPPTVLCCGNDKMALRVYGVLRSRGIRVPEHVSVAGYDNHRIIADMLFPPLTTVELPYARMGMRAAERLAALISGEGRENPAPLLVAGAVEWRSSVVERRPEDVSNT